MLDEVSERLAAADKNLEGAEGAVGAFAQGLEEAKGRIARNGFAGVAANLSRVGDDAQKLQAMTADVRSTVQGAAGQARSVTDQSTPTEVVDQMTPAVKGCDDGLTGLNNLAQATGQAQQHVNSALSGGSPGQLLAKLNNVRSFQRAAYKDVAEAKKAAEAALTKARQAGE